MGNKLRHEGDEVRIKVIWPDIYIYITEPKLPVCYHCIEVHDILSKPILAFEAIPVPAPTSYKFPSGHLL